MLDTLLFALILTALLVLIVEVCGIRRVLEDRRETGRRCWSCGARVGEQWEAGCCPACGEWLTVGQEQFDDL